MIKIEPKAILNRSYSKGDVFMGRDDSKSKGTNKGSLPQTPKNAKIAPGEMREEIAQELNELHELAQKAKKQK